MTNRIYMFSAALMMAGCSSAMSEEAPNTAIVTQGGVTQGGPGYASTLDGAPPLAPPPVVPPAMVRAPEPVPPVVVVQRVVQRMSCDIEVRRTSRGIRITPVVRTDRSVSGEYSLVITKDGAGGASDISQGGPFDAARGKRVELGSSEFSMERGAKFRAVLKVRAGGDEVCRDVRTRV